MDAPRDYFVTDDKLAQEHIDMLRKEIVRLEAQVRALEQIVAIDRDEIRRDGDEIKCLHETIVKGEGALEQLRAKLRAD
jgi:hypothetical protein